MIQIVIDTLNRLPELQRTLTAIWERTATPYRLHVIDDASTDGNQEWLQVMHAAGKIDSLNLRAIRLGIHANWNEVAVTGDSDIVVYSCGDVLCPLVAPDWLARGLATMEKYPDIGLLSLNDPLCTAKGAWKVAELRDDVTLTDRVPSFFLFARRALMQKIVIPPVGKKMYKLPVFANYKGIDRIWSRGAQAHGYHVGFMNDTYCQHIGLHSVRADVDLTEWADAVGPVDPETLEPLEERNARG